MPKFKIIGGRRGRAFLSLEQKIKALGDILVKQRPRDEILKEVYSKAGRELPENTSVVVQNWKKAVQDRLDRNDPYTIRLCQENQIIEEASAEAVGPTRKRGRPRKSPA
jgi:hypothetical protein